MEGNRDEAEKCIGIAREALEAGDRDRALRFLGKAQKLYPTDAARGERAAGPAPGPVCPGRHVKARSLLGSVWAGKAEGFRSSPLERANQFCLLRVPYYHPLPPK